PISLPEGGQGLDRVTFWRGTGVAAHNRAPVGDQQRDIRAEEADGGLASEPGSLQPRVEQFLVNRGDLAPAGQVRAVEGEEVGGFGEGCGEGRAVTPIPTVEDPRIQLSNGVVVGHQMRLAVCVTVRASALPKTITR